MTALERLQNLLRELFQLDLADLDFGLYRLLHLKRREVEAFLSEQLPRQVDEAFAAVTGAEQAELESRLSEVVQQIKDNLGADALSPTGGPNPVYANAPLVKRYAELRAQLSAIAVTEARKAEVFNHLYNFFSRYYEDGDFIPKRRYGAHETYTVPYSGEEVFFHWANKDQHYVKSTETLKDYAFKVSTIAGEFRVRFALTEASVPKDNVKGDRRFFFPRSDTVSFDAGARTLTIPFEYRPPTEAEIQQFRKTDSAKDPDQDNILTQAVAPILKAVPDDTLAAALEADQRTEKDRDEGKPVLPLLLKRLRHFARRQTSDYFVHKDLRDFLRRELEFYVKDRVLHLEDIEGDFESKRRVIRAFRRLSEQVIEFLAQIEDAQKTLFEKKKFVLETSYLIPIQHVPRPFWRDIIQNESQRRQWQEWFVIEPTRDLFNKKGEVNEAFLEQHPTLVVDTRHFDPDWTRRLLESLPFPCTCRRDLGHF